MDLNGHESEALASNSAPVLIMMLILDYFLLDQRNIFKISVRTV